MTATPVAAPDHAALKPPGTREFTLRSVIVAIAVAAVIGGSYPYVVLKLGFGPNISVVSAFFGYLALGIAFRDFNRWENNIVQTAGTSAGQTAFLCVLMAAFDMLAMDPDEDRARSSLRLTFGHTSSIADVDALVDALPAAVERARRAGGLRKAR